jgi:lipid-binding SYLF domain-containing protein
MKRLLEDKFTLGGDASVAAGPVGRDAAAQTDAEMHAEMLSWSRSRGIFAGLTLEGATLRPDHDADKELYGHDASNREILMGDFKTPPAAAKLEVLLNRNSMHRDR